MIQLWRTMRDLMPLLPSGGRRFIVGFAIASGALSVLDIAALGLAALVMGPLVSGSSVTLPIVGEISQTAQFAWVLAIISMLIVLKGLLALALQWYATRQFAKFELEISRRLLGGFLAMPWSVRLQRNSAEIVRSTDVGVSTTIAGVVIPFAQLIGEICTFVAVLLVLLIAQPVMALVAIAYFGIVGGVLLRWIIRQSVQAGRVNREYSTRATRLLSEMFHALKEITLRGTIPDVTDQVLGVRQLSARARSNMSFLSVVPRYILEIALIGGFALAAGVGYASDGASGAIAAVALFAVAGFRVVPSLTRFQAIMSQTASSIPFAQTVIEQISEGREYLERRQGHRLCDEPLPDDAQALVLKNLSFRYPGAESDAVHDVTLSIPFGASVAIVGSSGSGKSTLVDILLGLLEPTAGTIAVDDTPLDDVLTTWQSRVGYVPQDVALFDASIAQNVALSWSPDASDETRVRESLAQAQMLTLVEARPGGVHAPIGERGMRVSGGQRQRIGIARALFTEPRVLVMDEATSALDTETEAAITDTIGNLRGQLTLIVVAHRLATIRDSDIVCFMRDGELVAQGTFDEVVATVPDFAHQAALAGLRGETTAASEESSDGKDATS